MDDILDFFLDLLGEFMIWEQMNRFFRKKIPFRPLRWLVVTSIFILIVAVVIVVISLIVALFR